MPFVVASDADSFNGRLKVHRAQFGGPAGGGIYVAPNNEYAFQFLQDKPAFRRWGNRPDSGKTNAELTAEKLWGNESYTQAEFEYGFTNFSDTGTGVNHTTTYHGHQNIVNYLISNPGPLSELGWRITHVDYDQYGNNIISITNPKNTMIGVVDGVQTIINPDEDFRFMKQLPLNQIN